MEKLGTEHKKTMCIYKIINNVTGKVYVGSTVNLYGRITNHLRVLNNGTHYNMELQKDWNIYKSKNFTLEIIEIVKDKDLLHELEKKYIDMYEEDGVYNVSDPTKENMHWRQEKSIRYKDSDTKEGESILSKTFIIRWLDENFSNLIEKMKMNIDEKNFYDASKFDEWIIERIDDVEIKNDHRIIEIIHKWYNSHKFCVIPSIMYKVELKELFGISFYPNKIIITNELNRKLYIKKNKKIHKIN